MTGCDKGKVGNKERGNNKIYIYNKTNIFLAMYPELKRFRGGEGGTCVQYLPPKINRR